jgi:hypothetical protein
MRRLILAALLTALASVAHAQSWLDQPGTAGTTVVQVGEAKVTLPPGDWTQVAQTTRTHAGDLIPLEQRIFIQTQGNQIAAVAYLTANGKPADTPKGFLPNRACFRDDVFLNDSKDLYPGQFDCLIVNHDTLFWNHEPQPIWKAAIEAMKAFGGTPHPVLTVELFKASPSREGYASLWIGVNPALSGFKSTANIAWANSEWNKNNTTPDRVAFLKKLAAWGEAYRPVFGKSWE